MNEMTENYPENEETKEVAVRARAQHIKMCIRHRLHSLKQHTYTHTSAHQRENTQLTAIAIQAERITVQA